MSFSSAEAQPMEGTYGNTDYAGAQQPRVIFLYSIKILSYSKHEMMDFSTCKNIL